MGHFIRRSVRMIYAHTGLFAIFCASAVAQVAYKLGAAYCYQQIFDEGIIRANLGLLYRAIALLAGLLVVFATGLFLQERSTSALGSRIAGGLRSGIFLKLLAASSDFHARTSSSEFVDRVGNDVNAVELALVRAVPVVLVQGSLIFASVAILLLIEWRLALVIFACTPLTLFISKPFASRAGSAALIASEARIRLLAMTQDVVIGHQIIRLFGLGARSVEQFDSVLSDLTRSASRAQFLTGLVARSTQVASGITHLVVIGFGGWLAWRGYMTGGSLIAFVGLLMEIISAVNAITGALLIASHGAEGLARIDALLKRPGDTRDRANARPLTPPRREIRFDEVSFSYDAHQILRGVSFVVRPGETVALVGPSGAGKSTVLALLAKLYEPQSGAIRLDGMSLAEATDASIRQIIAAVPQTSVLFRGTVRDNIALGRIGATEREIVAAARAAAVHDVIMLLPDGYDTQVGEGGAALSVGQRQRIAVARALLRDAPILILDEATSALDPASEVQINNSIAELAGRRTVFAVTHRLSSIVSFDRILVFESGMLVQDGTHDALLAQGGLYASLWEKSSGSDSGEADGTPAASDREPTDTYDLQATRTDGYPFDRGFAT